MRVFVQNPILHPLNDKDGKTAPWKRAFNTSSSSEVSSRKDSRVHTAFHHTFTRGSWASVPLHQLHSQNHCLNMKIGTSKQGSAHMHALAEDRKFYFKVHSTSGDLELSAFGVSSSETETPLHGFGSNHSGEKPKTPELSCDLLETKIMRKLPIAWHLM